MYCIYSTFNHKSARLLEIGEMWKQSLLWDLDSNKYNGKLF